MTKSLTPMGENGTCLAYLVSKFPTITEAWIVREIDAVEEQGLPISLYTIRQEHPKVIHDSAKPWIPRLHVAPYRSVQTWLANLVTLLQQPVLYVSLLLLTLRELWGCWHFLVRDLFAFPKAVAFARMMKAEGIQHIHAHWATHTAYMAYIIHRLTGISYSFTGHAHDIYIRKAMLPLKIHAARFVATISHFNLEEMVHDAGESSRQKIHVVRCGVSPEHLQPANDSAPRDQPYTILTVASLRDYKGYPYAVEACRLLKKWFENGETGDFQWLAMGSGPDRSQIEALIEQAGVADKFRLLGPGSEHDVLCAMQKADVFVLPSIMLADRRMEGLPVVLMEALAVELPTVATNISGISELVEDGVTGRLVPERDPEALAQAVIDLRHNPKKAKALAQAGRQRVLSEFTAAKNATHLYELFQEALNFAA